MIIIFEFAVCILFFSFSSPIYNKMSTYSNRTL